MSNWKQGAEAYLPTLSGIEQTYGLPTDLLARVAFQECSWRPAVIDGSVASSAGALGMFQLMPYFFPGAGISWQADAVTAAKYLSELHAQFDDDWQLAVAAYNWGPGNVEKYQNGTLKELPLETYNYVRSVFTDVPIAGVILNA